MCGRYRIFYDADGLAHVTAATWHGDDAQHHRPNHNIRPTTRQPVIVRSHNAGSAAARPGNARQRELRLMRWGLVPTFSKTPTGEGLPLMINARSEGISSKSSFRHALEHGQRCVVPTNGFYEWHKTSRRGKSTPALQPYLVRHADDKERPLMLAGLYEVWREGHKDEVRSFTVLTREPTAELKWLHDRMPVILDGEDDFEGWLNGDVDVDEVSGRQWGERKGLSWVKMEKTLDKELKGVMRGIDRWFAKSSKRTGNPERRNPVGKRIKEPGKSETQAYLPKVESGREIEGKEGKVLGRKGFSCLSTSTKVKRKTPPTHSGEMHTSPVKVIKKSHCIVGKGNLQKRVGDLFEK